MLGCCAAGVAVLLGTKAHGAANDQPYPVGELSSTMGGAAVAIIRDGTSPWYNPAGLGRVTDEGISATLNVYGLQMERTQGFLGTADLSGNSTAIFPGSLGYVKPLGVTSSGMHHALGLAVVVPDFARHELALDATVLDNGNPFEMHVRERLLEQTLWIVPGWGACFGPNLCLGVALHVGYWSSTGLYSLFAQYADPTNGATAVSNVSQEEYSAALLSGSMGVQWQVSNGFWLGASLRLPARAVWGGGRLLVTDGYWDESGSTPDYVRRASDDKMKIDQRLPLNLRVGIGYEAGDWLLAADLSLSLSQGSYAAVRTHDGSSTIQPVDAAGVPVDQPVDVGVDDARNAIFNVNLGAQYRLSHKTSIQGGFFTDFSGRPDSLIDEIHNHVNHYGITAGVGMKGASSSTFVGIIAVLGSGSSYGATLPDFQEKHVSASSNAIYFTLGGSTRLGEAPEPKAPPAPPPPPPEEMQPPAAPMAPAVAPEPPREEKVKPASKAKRKVKAKPQAPE
jgi:hypothetical protein